MLVDIPLLSAATEVDARMTIFESRTSILQNEQQAMKHSIDNLTVMIFMLLPPNSATFASILAYETELKFD